MNKSLYVVATAILMAGCANDYSGDTYEGRAVGEVSQTHHGTIVSMRKIKIKSDEGLGSGAAIGGAAGALAGSFFGKGSGKLLGAAIGGVAGGTAGHMIQSRDQDGFEYIVRLDSGSTVTVTQGKTPALLPGQSVNVIVSSKGRSRVVAAD